MSINVDHWPPAWAYAHDGPVAEGDYRAAPEDFYVEERLDFAPEGQGEHLWLWLEKRDLTTLELARRLASACDVSPRAIGFSGMKDRVAVTRQWLSVHLPGREAPDDLVARLGTTPVSVLEQHRHPRKLKRGVHRSNRFVLRVTGPVTEHAEFEARWQRVCAQGVPNYFGPQRFGPQGRNLDRARNLLIKGWRKRDDREGLMLSAARSYLFNELLATRVVDSNWSTLIDGDVAMLDGSASVFAVERTDADLIKRAAQLDLHPTGLLWGQGASRAEHDAAEYEKRLGDRYSELCAGLERAGVKMARRALRIKLTEASLRYVGNACELRFDLPRGAFATAVLRELMTHPTL